MKTKSLIIMLIASLLVNCSPSTEPSISSLSVTQNDNHLTVTNNSNETVYLFVVEQERAAIINWSTHFDDLKISSNGSTNIDYKNISGLNQPYNSSDKVIIYFWYKSDKTTPEIFTKVVEL